MPAICGYLLLVDILWLDLIPQSFLVWTLRGWLHLQNSDQLGCNNLLLQKNKNNNKKQQTKERNDDDDGNGDDNHSSNNNKNKNNHKKQQLVKAAVHGAVFQPGAKSCDGEYRVENVMMPGDGGDDQFWWTAHAQLGWDISDTWYKYG